MFGISAEAARHIMSDSCFQHTMRVERLPGTEINRVPQALEPLHATSKASFSASAHQYSTECLSQGLSGSKYGQDPMTLIICQQR